VARPDEDVDVEFDDDLGDVDDGEAQSREQRDDAEPPKFTSTVIVVGGGRGGVGKSVVATNVAVYLAQLGKQVILVDADPTAANLHTQCGVSAGANLLNLEDQKSFERALVETDIPGLTLLPATHDSVRPEVPLRGNRRNRWLLRLRSLPTEFLVIDVGPGHSGFVVDMLLAADLPITVTAPEPPAIEATYRLLRAMYISRLRRNVARDRLHVTFTERMLVEIGRLPSPLMLVRALAKTDSRLAAFAWSECQRLRLYVVVNQTRMRLDLELGTWMAELARTHYGLRLEELGHIEQDDAVWLAVRRKRPLLVDSPASKSARNLERIARRVLALSMAKERTEVQPLPPLVPDLYEVLHVARSASDEDVRRAYKKQREVYSPTSVAISSLFSPETLRAQESRLDEAYDTLLDPIRRRAYDLSNFPDLVADVNLTQGDRPPLAAEQLLMRSELLREIGPDTEFTGALLRKVREANGIDLEEIAAKTKIARMHLDAIENEEPRNLPAMVYIRGFVIEFAKYLRLDPQQVQRTYLRRVEAKLTQQR
jgi:flagellar biosynthesis protein FlhG